MNSAPSVFVPTTFFNFPTNHVLLKPIQDEGEKVAKRSLPISFSSLTFTNVTNSPKNFLTFSCNLFSTFV